MQRRLFTPTPAAPPRSGLVQHDISARSIVRYPPAALLKLFQRLFRPRREPENHVIAQLWIFSDEAVFCLLPFATIPLSPWGQIPTGPQDW